jgi:hypothetical protein
MRLGIQPGVAAIGISQSLAWAALAARIGPTPTVAIFMNGTERELLRMVRIVISMSLVGVHGQVLEMILWC